MTTPPLAATINGERRYGNPQRHGGAHVYASVTHVAHAMPGNWQIPWAARVVAEKAVERIETIRTMKADEAVSWLKREPYSQRDSGATRGTLTHEAMEAILAGQEPVTESGYTQAAKAFVRDLGPVIEAVELTLFNEDHLFAGTTDFVGRLEGLPKLGRTIIDWKTSKSVYAEHMVQLVGGYALGGQYWLDDDLQEQEWNKPDSALVVLFAADASYTLFLVPMDQRLHRVFRACLEIRRYEALDLEPQLLDAELDWNEVWLRQWLESHPDQQLELANACRQAGIEIRRQHRTTDDTQHILSIIRLMEMEENPSA